MVIGINFTGITEDLTALEDYRKALRLKKEIKVKGKVLRLQGLTDKEDHAKKMFYAADRSKRSIVEIQAPNGWIAFYIG